MTKMRSLLVAIAVIGVSARSGAQTTAETLHRYLVAAAADGQINGTTLIGQNGRVLFESKFGFADLVNKTPLTDDTRFVLGSISKNFTAVAVLQLQEQGKLALDEPLAKYLARFPYPTITVRQVLSHTSGLPDADVLFAPLIAADPNRIIGLDDVLPAVIAYQSRHALLFPPGDRWSYSSVGYSLLAVLVQQLSGMPFPEYVQSKIFGPAGMTHSYIQTNLAQARESNRAVNFFYNNHFEMKLVAADTQPDEREWSYNLSGLHGGGNVISSAADLFRFDQALDRGVLLQPETIAEAYTPVKVNSGGHNHAAPGTGYGLGWFVDDDTSRGKIVWHSGAAPGVVTLFARNLGSKECYIVLLNLTCSNGIYHDILDIIRGRTIVYHPSLAFLYGRDLFQHGADYAACHLNALKDDTADYSLKESEIDRVGVEFSRVPKLGELAGEAYKINTFLFPASWQVYANYGNFLWSRTKNQATATMAYQKALALNPTNGALRKKLDELAKK